MLERKYLTMMSGIAGLVLSLLQPSYGWAQQTTEPGAFFDSTLLSDDLAASLAFQGSWDIYGRDTKPPILSPIFLPQIPITLQRSSEQIKVFYQSERAPDPAQLLVSFYPPDHQDISRKVVMDGMVNYLKAMAGQILSSGVKFSSVRDLRFVRAPIHKNPYISIEFSLTDGQRVYDFNLCLFVARPDSRNYQSLSMWKVSPTLVPVISDSQDFVRFLRFKPLTFAPQQEILWLLHAPHIKSEVKASESSRGIKKYFANALSLAVRDGVESWNIYQRSPGLSDGGVIEKEQLGSQGEEHESQRAFSQQRAFSPQRAFSQQRAFSPQRAFSQQRAVRGAKQHSFVGWTGQEVRLGDYGYSFVTLTSDDHHRVLSDSSDPAHFDLATTTHLFDPNLGLVSSAMIHLSSPRIRPELITASPEDASQSLADLVGGDQQWLEDLAYFRWQVHHEVGHALGMEDNLKGSSVVADQPVLSAMDHHHPVIAQQLFREGKLAMPLKYDQAFMDAFYNGFASEDIVTYPQCTHDLWGLLNQHPLSSLNPQHLPELAVWESLAGHIDPFCQRKDLFFSVNDGLRFMKNRLSQEVDLAGRSYPSFMEQLADKLAVIIPSSQQPDSVGWQRNQIIYQLREAIHLHYFASEPSYFDLFSNSIYQFLLWPRYGTLFDASREENTMMRFVRGARWFGSITQYALADSWLTQTEDLAQKSSLSRFSFPLEYKVFYTQQRSLLFGFYKDVVHLLAGSVDSFEVLPTPLVVSEMVCSHQAVEKHFAHEDECLEMLSPEIRSEILSLATIFADLYVSRFRQLLELTATIQRSETSPQTVMSSKVILRLMEDLVQIYNFETLLSDEKHRFIDQPRSVAAIRLFMALASWASVFSDSTDVRAMETMKDPLMRVLRVKQNQIREKLGEEGFADLLTLPEDQKDDFLREQSIIGSFLSEIQELD